MLRRTKLFLFRHGGNYSILRPVSDVFAVRPPAKGKKSSFFEKKSLSRVDDDFPLATLLTPPEAGPDDVGVVLAYFGTANWNSILSRHDEGCRRESGGGPEIVAGDQIGFFCGLKRAQTAGSLISTYRVVSTTFKS
jgi:hypothetical protein